MASDAGGSQLEQQCVLLFSDNQRLKRFRPTTWKVQGRGRAFSRGNTFDGEGLTDMTCCLDSDTLLAFTEDGLVFTIQVSGIPLAKKMNGSSTELSDLVPEWDAGKRIVAFFAIPHQKSLADVTDKFALLVSERGMAKKVSLDKLRGLRTGKAVQCMSLEPWDKLRCAHLISEGQGQILVCATTQGYVLRFAIDKNFRSASLTGPCVSAVRLRVTDRLASVAVQDVTPEELAVSSMAAQELNGDGVFDDGSDQEGAAAEDEAVEASAKKASKTRCILIITAAGMGKRVSLSYARMRLSNRGMHGRRAIRLAPQDRVVSVSVVTGETKELMPARSAFSIFHAEHQNDEMKENDITAAYANGNETEGDASRIKRNALIFSRLPEEERKVYRDRAHGRRLEAAEYYKRVEGLLIGSVDGRVSRLAVPSVPVMSTACMGKSIIKGAVSAVCRFSPGGPLPDTAEPPQKRRKTLALL